VCQLAPLSRVSPDSSWAIVRPERSRPSGSECESHTRRRRALRATRLLVLRARGPRSRRDVVRSRLRDGPEDRVGEVRRIGAARRKRSREKRQTRDETENIDASCRLPASLPAVVVVVTSTTDVVDGGGPMAPGCLSGRLERLTVQAREQSIKSAITSWSAYFDDDGYRSPGWGRHASGRSGVAFCSCSKSCSSDGRGCERLRNDPDRCRGHGCG